MVRRTATRWATKRLVLGFLLLAMASCGGKDGCTTSLDEPETQPISVDCPDGMELGVTEMTLAQGRQASVIVVGGHTSCPVTWSVDNDGVLGLQIFNSQGGVLTARSVGQTIIHAFRGEDLNGPEATCTVTILANTFSNLIIAPDSLTMNAHNDTAGEILLLQIFDSDGQLVQPLEDVFWTSSDTTVVSIYPVMQQGSQLIVLGGDPGQATITALYSGPCVEGEALRDSCLVNVIEAEAP